MTEDGVYLKEIKAFSYENHRCQRLFQGSKYIYTYGKNGTIDCLNPKNLSHISTFDINGKYLRFALEVNDEYIFFGCAEGSAMFCFDLKSQ